MGMYIHWTIQTECVCLTAPLTIEKQMKNCPVMLLFYKEFAGSIPEWADSQWLSVSRIQTQTTSTACCVYSSDQRCTDIKFLANALPIWLIPIPMLICFSRLFLFLKIFIEVTAKKLHFVTLSIDFSNGLFLTLTIRSVPF